MEIPQKISIVVPFFNESANVDLFYKELMVVLARIKKCQFEIVCVDDGSSDDTLTRLVDIASQDDRFIVLQLSRNFGKEAALTAGIDASSGDALIPMDADLQDPPSLIIEMIDSWMNGADVVLARRADRSSDAFFKRITARLFYKLHNKVSDIKIPDNVGDFRLMDRVVINSIKLLPERNRFMKGLFSWVGYKTVTIDYVRTPRALGKSKFSGWRLWNFAIEGITSFSSVPLKFWSYIGLAGAFLTLIYGLYIVTHTIIYGVDVPGYASLLVAILFFGSLQLIGVGVLGEYIGRIYMEAKGRPIYLVKACYGKKSNAGLAIKNEQ